MAKTKKGVPSLLLILRYAEFKLKERIWWDNMQAKGYHTLGPYAGYAPRLHRNVDREAYDGLWAFLGLGPRCRENLEAFVGHLTQMIEADRGQA